MFDHCEGDPVLGPTDERPAAEVLIVAASGSSRTPGAANEEIMRLPLLFGPGC
jgi:hypothetical protein